MSPVIGGSTLDEVEEDELPEGLTLDELTPVETVTGTLRGLFDGYDRFDDSYLVGEVSDVSSSSEHLYFSISAATSGDTETLKCVIWGSQRDDIEVDIGSEMLVAVRGTLHFFESGGHPSLEVSDAHLVGESAYWQRIAQLRENLESEGLLDDERKSSLPRFPREIGIVTATGSDAEQDLIESIHSRYPSVDIRVQGSTVQGSSAPAELADAIETLEQSQVDVIVVARGGGSDTALRVFNEESVVRAVVDAETPTVAAIGHDADEPLIDEVADERVKTPTAAGDAVVIDREEFQTRLEDAAEGVDAAYHSQVQRWRQQHTRQIESAYSTLADQWIETQSTVTEMAYADRVDNWLDRHRAEIDRSHQTCSTSWIKESRQALDQHTLRQAEAWIDNQQKQIDVAYSNLISTWLQQARSDTTTGYDNRAETWARTHRGDITRQARELQQDWFDTHRREIESQYQTLSKGWIEAYRSGIELQLSNIEEQTKHWLQTHHRDIEERTSQLIQQWVTTQRQTIENTYQDGATDWIDRQRTEIEQEVDRIEREHSFEAEKAGLERRNKALIAAVVVLLLLLIGVVVVAL